MFPLSPRDPRIEQNAPGPDDSCSDREVARGLKLRSGVFPEDIVMTSKILPVYVFPCVVTRILPEYVFSYLNDKIVEDRGQYLARDTRCRRIFVRICSPPSPSPSINIRHPEKPPSNRYQSRRLRH
ncbi:hypothetical protein F511_08557 [Dorcoceras hygrometricum]|uniref:Uncharacterized protein n=1 Tax=Dorcoceras hygrometricum TaxID=472368 RepID=A0A2Z7D143_9LAMI|nr:hypothetical protein F511_08557 [Dorcoceras hygrometricum]